ncbi:unnamed protein product [Periconia digitata]|uniref:Uncharacterized protein n=1 Tax=Periconia digitata TaxID=1303443 RepID=A0A9W4UJ68_9PLEO|nr:unnamed protein product [Periconia digitata]
MKPYTCILPFLIPVSIHAAATACYAPNGAIVQDTPCSTTSTHSTCCRLGYACLSNNLCALTSHAPPEFAENSPTLLRSSCTDKSWASEDCPSMCTNGTAGDKLGQGGTPVKQCDGAGRTNRYYCANDQTKNIKEGELCTNATLHVEFPEAVSTLTVIGVSATSSPPSQSTSTPQNTASTSPKASKKPHSSSTETTSLGLGLGLGLGIPLLLGIAAAIFFFVRRRSGKQQAQQHYQHQLDTAKGPYSQMEVYRHESGEPRGMELNATSSAIHEIDSGSMHELPGRNVM